MIHIVDYGCGNLANVKNALDFIGLDSVVTSEPVNLVKADKIILPGVGAFRPAAELLKSRELAEVVIEKAKRGTPLLGICLGMQLMFTESFEDGRSDGLDLIQGAVRRFSDGVKIPQIGWNSLIFEKDSPLTRGIQDGSYTYFVHGYHCVPENDDDVIARSEYGEKFTAVVGRDNIFGVQFHPEKSQNTGLQLLKNFGAL